MKYVGIDLGTTNSAISSYDGELITLYKSPEQHDVTPSALFIDKRGNKYVGSRAYNNAARSPNNAATLFKRLIGTSTPIKLPAVDLVMTPEECSTEIIKVLYSYLPEEIRSSSETGTVITVPAAFNQMQKDATLSAANNAGLINVALMQEPVAAVMSVMKKRNNDGIFLVFDLGGGTLDIALAESISGRVSLLSHGGIAMCGGRDFDRILFDNIIKPWLTNNFNLPESFSSDPKYKTLMRMGMWATEKAKIDLSTQEETIVSLSESEIALADLNGEEIYIDITISREQLNALIDDKIQDAISAARETIEKAGLTPHDIERVVFVGGPTHYKPLRDKVSFELGISPSTDVNPMTAVSEGAAIFAESIDWSSENRSRKSSKGSLNTNPESIDLKVNYIARTPDTQAKVVVKLGSSGASFEMQIDCMDTGWSTGRIELSSASSVKLPLSKNGENNFKLFVFDSNGQPIKLEEDTIIISRTAANIDAIPASHSVGIETLDKIGGQPVLDYLVKEGEHLPVKGQRIYKAEQTLKANSSGTIKFKLWEGDIKSPVSDNRFIGLFEIRGSDFDDGAILSGAELICDYEVTDSGNVKIEVSVPSIGGAFEGQRNFYSRQDGEIDYTKAHKLIEEESRSTLNRIEEIESSVGDEKLTKAKNIINQTNKIANDADDPESAKQAMDNIQEAKKLLAEARNKHLKPIREIELEKVVETFDSLVREYARPSEQQTFDNLVITAKRAIESNSTEFESHLAELRSKSFLILWKQDWFIAQRFKWLAEDSHLFIDSALHDQLVNLGHQAMASNDIEKLREVVYQLDSIKVGSGGEDEMMSAANIVRG
ncbi:Chaperone protein DnaK [Pseudoalteromonas luteoviolacea B = ATCC 29581]|nr:Chaperone protein DnaK [Pseudoalteromonas luteoviolacea B = ATCC 29581]